MRPKDSKNPSKLEWDGDGGAIMVLVERIGSIVNCQLWWRRPNLTTGHLVAPLPLAYLFPLSISNLQHLTLKQIVIVPFKLGEKDAIVTPGILFRTTEEPPKIILCKFMPLKASLP